MGQLNQATQQNASASEELAATAEELGSQAAQLQELMTFFQLADRGRSRPTRDGAPRRAPPGGRTGTHQGTGTGRRLTPAEHDFERF
jgi:methyl-accepting chemotaxis protein